MSRNKLVLDSMKQYKEARKLYEKCGFNDCSRYNDTTYTDVFMKLELKCVRDDEKILRVF